MLIFLLKAPLSLFGPISQFLALDLHLGLLGLLISAAAYVFILFICYGLPIIAVGYLVCRGYLFYFNIVAGRPFRFTPEIYRLMSASIAVLFLLAFGLIVLRDVQQGWTKPMVKRTPQPVFYTTDPKWFVATLLLNGVQIAALWAMLTGLLSRLVVEFKPPKTPKITSSPAAPASPPPAAPRARTDGRAAPPP